jgi:hypothetical protein
MQLQRNRKRWTPQQREQSRKFWEKKELREARKREGRIAAYHNKRLRERGSELGQLAALGVSSGPAGSQSPIAPRVAPLVPPDPHATMGYKEVTGAISDFLHPDHPIRSTANDGGPQFIQNFDDGPTQVTRRVGLDVEPSSHVRKLKPHLNLQTQHGGEIQGGALADPHAPVASADPFPSGHPLHGLQPEEQRKFVERHLKSSGFNVKR